MVDEIGLEVCTYVLSKRSLGATIVSTHSPWGTGRANCAAGSIGLTTHIGVDANIARERGQAMRWDWMTGVQPLEVRLSAGVQECRRRRMTRAAT